MRSIKKSLWNGMLFLLPVLFMSFQMERAVCPACPERPPKEEAPAIYLNEWMQSRKQSLESVFGVEATFSMYDDSGAPNAYAYWVEPGSGKVTFGKSFLLNFLMQGEKGKWAVLSVLAHEYGHILQMEKETQLSGKALELQADFLAGYYLGQVLPDSLKSEVRRVMAACFYDVGDYWIAHPDHHGTPEERMAAALEGFARANMCLDNAFTYSEQYAGYR